MYPQIANSCPKTSCQSNCLCQAILSLFTYFFKQNIIRLTDINKLQTACFVYKAGKYLLPTQFRDFLLANSSIHKHDTRQSNKLHCLSHRLKICTYSIRVHGTKLWNTLNPELTSLPTVDIFKKHYKYYLISSSNVQNYCVSVLY